MGGSYSQSVLLKRTMNCNCHLLEQALILAAEKLILDRALLL